MAEAMIKTAAVTLLAVCLLAQRASCIKCYACSSSTCVDSIDCANTLDRCMVKVDGSTYDKACASSGTDYSDKPCGSNPGVCVCDKDLCNTKTEDLAPTTTTTTAKPSGQQSLKAVGVVTVLAAAGGLGRLLY